MSPLTTAVLIAATLSVARLLLPREHRPRWSRALPVVALALVVMRLATISIDVEMLPLLVLAVITTIAALREPRHRAPTEGTRNGWLGALLGATTVAVCTLLLVLGISMTLMLHSEPIVRGPVPLETPCVGSDAVAVVAEHPFLRAPRDLAFDPLVPDRLWVVNAQDHSVAILHDVCSSDARIEYRRDGKATHFMHRPSAIAFGSPDATIGRVGTFATAQESMDDAVPFLERRFMGPTLFAADLDVFARRVSPWLLGSHLDMLHESPLAMGIAWERDHVYWVFGGYLGTISRYDFVEDHGVGHDDHANGVIRHYGRDVVRRVPGVPSHLAFHGPSEQLYIADTAEGRVLTLDTRSGRLGGEGPGWEEGVDTRWVEGAEYRTLVAPGRLERPSGLLLHDDRLFVGDHATGILHVFTLGGAPLTTIDTGTGADALMGLTVGSDDALYAVDASAGRVLRIEPGALAAR